MRLILGLNFLLFCSFYVFAQEAELPEDLRQHNLTQFNSSLLNPTYSFDFNRPSAISLWSRWQWQTIDGDPTTILLNYTGKINSESAFGVGFLQHNTGTFLNTGGILNYVHALDLGSGVKILVGANVLGFQRELADDRFVTDDDIDLPQLQANNEFLLQFSPAARLLINDFSLALGLENAFNLLGGEGANPSRVFVGALSNDFPVDFFNDGNSLIRPMLYVKTIPNSDTQVGVNALLSTSKFWFQAGYNSFYGPSAGAGITFLKSLSVGGLIEFPTGSDLADENSTFELLLSYNFGTTDNRRKVVGFEVDEEEEPFIESLEEEQPIAPLEKEEEKPIEALEQKEAERQQQETDSIAQAREEKIRQVIAQQQAERLQREKDSIARNIVEQRRMQVEDSISRVEAAVAQRRIQDSLIEAKQKEEELLRQQKRVDSLAEVQNQEVEVKPNEKYEEVVSADGLQPGFYLIANVFGTKKYFENFMRTLQAQGLEPKSFYRSLNKYNYVYLKRYATIEEARQARDSRFNGRYTDKTWIFRVRGD